MVGLKILFVDFRIVLFCDTVLPSKSIRDLADISLPSVFIGWIMEVGSNLDKALMPEEEED